MQKKTNFKGVDEKTSPFSPSAAPQLSRANDFLGQFLKSCSRFTPPYGTRDRLELEVARRATSLPVFESMRVIPLFTIAPNWQVLLNYLYRQGITVAPNFTEAKLSHDLPSYYQIVLQCKFDQHITDGQDRSSYLKGLGLSVGNLEEAYSKAVGEALERYFLTIYKKKNLLFGSYNEMQAKRMALHPRAFNSYTPQQIEMFEQLFYSDDMPIEWVLGEELISGEKALVPAQHVFWNWGLGENEPILLHATTNGSAGHFTRTEAISAAIHEAVQRDAFFIYWLNSISPPIIKTDLNILDHSGLREIVTALEQLDIRIYFLDTTTDIEIPSCACLLIDQRGGEPVASVGGGAGFSIVANLLSAVLEALSVLNYSVSVPTSTLPAYYRPFLDPTIDHQFRLSMWRGKEMLEKLAFLHTGQVVSLKQTRFYRYAHNFDSPEAEYTHLKDMFKKRGEGYELYTYEVQDPILSKLGYHVARVVIPQLFPLYLNEHWATLRSVRLKEAPQRMGIHHTRLNPWPHPFP